MTFPFSFKGDYPIKLGNDVGELSNDNLLPSSSGLTQGSCLSQNEIIGSSPIMTICVEIIGLSLIMTLVYCVMMLRCWFITLEESGNALRRFWLISLNLINFVMITYIDWNDFFFNQNKVNHNAIFQID